MNWSDIFTIHNLTSLIDILAVWFLIYNLLFYCPRYQGSPTFARDCPDLGG